MYSYSNECEGIDHGFDLCESSILKGFNLIFNLEIERLQLIANQRLNETFLIIAGTFPLQRVSIAFLCDEKVSFLNESYPPNAFA